jgi:hypothetical protein
MKAYELALLTEELKLQGLPIVEDLAEKSYLAFKEYLKKSAVLSENKYDDIIVPFVDHLDVMVLPQIDKIDGIKG